MIDNVSASFSQGRCFGVSLSYRVRPTVSHEFFEITFDWDSDLYQVSGLSSTRMLTPLADGTYQATEKFEVCTPNLASSIILFPFTIEALANHDRAKPREWFKKFASVPFVFGSETWQTDLSGEIESLKAQIAGGAQDPFILRRYWRLLGTMYHGGASEYAAYLQKRVQTEVPSSTTAAQSQAYYALLLRNGENLSVMFDPATGRPASILFNKSYRLKKSYQSELLSLFQRGPISKLLRVDSADSFELVSEKEVGRLIMLRYKRVREGVTLLPDKLIVFVEPSGAEHTLRSIIASLGDVGGSDGTVQHSGIYTVPRWCSGENIELTLDNFQITERLAPDDADYFQIWLEEGEHLNVTYRGKIPAAIDVDGPDKQPASSMSRSMVNDFIIRGLVDGSSDRADHFSVGFGQISRGAR